ncbi:otoferlin [Drosophila sulfurigaster albostrigata]|uniref:otoferlin n=1 Tax=Drosophila sulfurigaster albostrigata TaxID=89887 RepID=UPI002D21D04C|nr:otoferlin [Drosophila sulfurigaster albostrigata]XP_062132087.1 otoferlin [Drosophila sulfurigaster albostrigata]
MNLMEDCFAGAPQEFLICITVHKAANTGVYTGDLYVKISLDKISKNTKTHSNSENPFFNEYFVFEFHCTLTELLRLTVLFELKKHLLYKKNVTLGELLIDLHSVWSQPSHSYFKKWGKLEAPISEEPPGEDVKETNAHLQIDLAIISQHSSVKTGITQDDLGQENINKYITTQNFDDIKSNLLHDVESYTQSNIRYFLRLYKGIFVKKSNYMLQVSFAGFKAKTQVAKNTMTPEWNLEFTFAWVYPSLAQRFLILIFLHEHLQWKCVAEYEISIEEIAFHDTPSLGPTYLHLYDPVNPLNYVGRILMELDSHMLSEDRPSHVLITKTIDSFTDTRNTADENFFVEFLPLLGNNIHTSSNSYKFVVKLAEKSSNDLVGTLKTPPGKFRTAMQTKCFRQDSPFRSCLFKLRLPDNRLKFVSDFLIIDIINFMRSELDVFRIYQLKYPNELSNQSKCLKFLLYSIISKLKEGLAKSQFSHDLGEDATNWDKNRQHFLQDFFVKLAHQLRALRQKLKFSFQEHLDAIIVDIVNEVQRLIGEITSLANSLRVQDDWPELLLTLSAGGKMLGTCRLNAKHFLFIQKLQKYQSTNQCWKTKSFVFKSLGCTHSCGNCGCNVGVILGCISIVLDRERREFLSCIAGDWSSDDFMIWQPNVVQTFISCQVYVHQAKVRPGAEHKPLSDGHVSVYFAEQAAETQTAPATLSPIWNAVISFKVLALPGSISWYLQNPPLISIEFYSNESELSGSGQTVVSVISGEVENESGWGDGGKCWQRSALTKLQKLKSISPPPLKWVPVARDGIVLAEVLMSAEFTELVGETDVYKVEKQAELKMGIPLDIRPNMLNYVLEVIFVGLRNYTKSMLSSVGKRRAKIMMADLVLSSGLSTSRVRNSINFLVAYASGVVSLPDQQEYWPAMVATDVVVNAFNKESTLGAALVPSSTSFLQKERSTKCVKLPEYSDDSHDHSSIITMDYDEETALEEMEDERVSKSNSCWKRIKIALGLNAATVANKLALKYDEYAESSDLHEDKRFTWWTKFYNSVHDDLHDRTHLCKHSLVIYPNELEQQPQFGFLQDWAVPVPLVHGVKFKKYGPPKEDIYATLKLQIKLTPCQCAAPPCDAGDGDMLRPLAAAMSPHHQTMIKTITETVHLTVRVYVVQGLQIRPRDWSSESDCYVKLSLGGKMVSDRAHYVPNQSNPIFGRFFELDASLPADPILELVLYDHDKRKDDLIGATHIDLEDRWHSKHHAMVGIPKEYSQVGYNQWHDIYMPSEILENLCQQVGIQPPYFYGNVIEVDGMLFGDETIIAKSEDLHERLSLTVLRNLDKLPSFGYKLVPEHVETRSLYHDDYPGVEQGKIQMWIELFKASMFIPTHIDITPTAPITYEVRIVVKNLNSIPFGDRNIFGKLMSDIYVTGWCQNVNKRQTTDIHFRSFGGEAVFNWRMIFTLKYSPNEDMMVIRRKGGLFEEIEIKTPPIVYLQVWDKDFITRDEYLGALELNLSNLPEPFYTHKQCQLFSSKRKRLNLFTRKSVKGWFPLQGCPGRAGIPTTQGGKMELQIDICTETEASNSPAGVGHDPPMALERPSRPESSFNPWTHPFKSLHLIFWPQIRKYVFIFVFMVLLGLGLVIFFSNLPNRLMSIPLE